MTAALLPAAFAMLVGGMLLADAGLLPPDAGAALIGVGVAAATVGRAARRSRPALAVAAALSLGAGLGAWRGADADLVAGPGSVAAAIGDREWAVTGTVADEPRVRGERTQLVLERIGLAADGGSARPASGRVLVWTARSTPVRWGDRVAFSAALTAPRDFDGFAYRDYLARQGIAAIATPHRLSVIGRDAPPLLAAAVELRGALLHGLQRTIPEPAAALAAGIILGVRGGIAPRIEDDFATAGLTHVVAISGWNIAIVAGCAVAAAAPLRARPGGRWLAPAVTILAIAFYVILTGATPSVVRAALMACAMLVAQLGGSRAHAASALMLASAVMLIAAPSVLWDVGFQLSALATLGLIIAGEPIARRLARWPGALREPVALTLAAQLYTLPIVILNFERLSLVAPLANVLVVPLVPPVMLLAGLAALVGAIDAAVHIPLLGDLIVWLVGGSAWLYLSVMILAGGWAASLPFAAVAVSPPAWVAWGIYPLLVVAWLTHRAGRSDRAPDRLALAPLTLRSSSRLRRGLSGVADAAAALATRLISPRLLGGATLLVLVACSLARAPDDRLHVTTLDVGQGDAILVEAPGGRAMLVDGGADPDRTLAALADALPLQEWRLEVVLLTHPHRDHVAGLIEVLRRYRVDLVLHSGRAYDNPDFPRFLAEAGPAELETGRAGRRVDLGAGASFELLYPTETDAASPIPDGDINNASLVGVLRYGAFEALLTGDAERPVEELLARRGLLGAVELLKVGHHGSDSSTGPALLAATSPRTATISVGAGNEYRHPHRATLDALVGVRVYRTDLDGSIEVVTDGRWFAARTAGGESFAAVASGPSATGEATITAWSSRPSWPPASFFSTSASPTASSCTARVSRGSRRRRPDWSPPRAFRWIRPSSRSPPCCTTSISSRPARAVVAMGTWGLRS